MMSPPTVETFFLSACPVTPRGDVWQVNRISVRPTDEDVAADRCGPRYVVISAWRSPKDEHLNLGVEKPDGGHVLLTLSITVAGTEKFCPTVGDSLAILFRD